jgi:four helix bundle protein
VATHKDLNIWKDSITLVTKIYELTSKFPEEEKFVLVSQMRRCAVSVPSNIAEGAARKNDKEFIQFLYISLGSLTELETQLIISNNLGYITNGTIINDIEKLIKSLLAFIKYLKSLNQE